MNLNPMQYWAAHEIRGQTEIKYADSKYAAHRLLLNGTLRKPIPAAKVRNWLYVALYANRFPIFSHHFYFDAWRFSTCLDLFLHLPRCTSFLLSRAACSLICECYSLQICTLCGIYGHRYTIHGHYNTTKPVILTSVAEWQVHSTLWYRCGVPQCMHNIHSLRWWLRAVHISVPRLSLLSSKASILKHTALLTVLQLEEYSTYMRRIFLALGPHFPP